MAVIRITDPGAIVMVGQNDKVIIDIPGGGAVTIIADPSEQVSKFEIRYVGDNEADTATVVLGTFDQNLHVDIKQYDPSDRLILLGSEGGQVDPDNSNHYNFGFTGADGQPHTGYVQAMDGGERDFNDAPIIICFAAGTLIDTPDGARPIESLRPGDLVLTRRNGAQPVRWIGSRHLDTLSLLRAPHLRPITLRAGALGAGRPSRDLMVSPQHRIEISDWRSEMLFGMCNVLVAAKHLVDGERVVSCHIAEVTYYHMLFDSHEVVTANGLPSESLHPGDLAIEAIGPAAMAELEALFPQLISDYSTRKTANPVLKSYEGRAMVDYAA